MVVGIPNVGKSTLISILSGRTIARTGDEPAITKSQQRIDLGGGLTLFDTPGILWPKVENPLGSYRLAATGAIRDTAMEYDDVGFFLAEYLLKSYPDLLKERFKLDVIPDTEDAFLQMAGVKRGAGFRRQGQSAQDLRAAGQGISQRKIGRISLETPAMMAQEQIGIDQAAAQRAGDKAVRKQRFKEGLQATGKKVRNPPGG